MMFLANPLFLIPFLTGVIFIAAGILLRKFPPDEINGLYGYRTLSSMKSTERWHFAQKYSALEMIKSGIVLILSCTAGLFYRPHPLTGTAIGTGVLFLLVIILFIRVERAIKNRFE